MTLRFPNIIKCKGCGNMYNEAQYDDHQYYSTFENDKSNPRCRYSEKEKIKQEQLVKNLKHILREKGVHLFEF